MNTLPLKNFSFFNHCLQKPVPYILPEHPDKHLGVIGNCLTGIFPFAFSCASASSHRLRGESTCDSVD